MLGHLAAGELPDCLPRGLGLHYYHHTGEDTGLFTFIAQRHPELAPALDRLRQEHQKIAALLDDLQEVISADSGDP